MSEVNEQSAVPTPEQLGNAATSAPSPGLAQALAGNAAAAPTPAPASAPSAPAPSPQPRNAKEAVDAHHAILGRVASALLGKQVDYRVNSQTGQTEAYEVPQKPGDLFRHILSGALLGMAAGKGTNSVLGGFSRGATAGMEANREADAQRYARAQQQFKDTQESERLQDEKRRTTAQLEMWNKEALLHDHEANLRDLEYHEAHNDRMQLVREKARDAGAYDASIPGNGEMGNGAKFEKLFASQPDMFRAPEGYERLVTTDTNMDGIRFDAKQGYVDEHGNPIDLASRTTWHVQFIPHNAAKDPMDISGAELNRAFPKTTGGLADPSKTYKMPLETVVGIGTKEHTSNRSEATEMWHAKHDAIMSELRELENKANNLTKQADEAERGFDYKTAKELRQQVTDVYKEYDDLKAQAHPNSKIRKANPRTNPVNPANQSKPGLKVGDIGEVNGKRVKVTKLNDKGRPVAGIPVDANGNPLQ